MQQRKAITKDEGVMLGKPTVAGTRLTVELILEKLAAGEGVGQIVESYPRLDREAVREALLFAAGRVEEVLAKLGLTEELLVDAVAEKVLVADVSQEQAMRAMQDLRGSDVRPQPHHLQEASRHPGGGALRVRDGR